MAGDLERLERIGRTLSRAAAKSNPGNRFFTRGAPPLPALILVADPVRTPDPVALAGRLPRGAGLIYRAFGAPDAKQTAAQLARIARRRGLVLLIGADAVRAPNASVHLPERMAHRVAPIRRARPFSLITVAAHSLPALIRARRGGAHAAILSAVFPSRSPSATRPLGPVRFAALVRLAGLPVYALGGIDAHTAPRLAASGAVGLAMVDGLAQALAEGRSPRT